MFNLFKRNKKRIERIDIQGHNVFINNQGEHIGKPCDIETVLKFESAVPEIGVYENGKLIRLFKIETLHSNPNLAGQFLHASVRVLANSAVMIDGIISKSNTDILTWKDDGYEAVRLQPFYLSNADDHNTKLIGKGLFERGLHYAGTITPLGVRNVCICDECKGSFTIQHFHAGFSEVQYFYSEDGKKTLVVPYRAIPDLPAQLQGTVEDKSLDVIESKISEVYSEMGFRYYNNFNCPHCTAPFINFRKNKGMRLNEYYGNIYINSNPLRWVS
jgi:hypothetical protein